MTIDPVPPRPFSGVDVYRFGTGSHERYGDPSAGPTAVLTEHGCELHLHFASTKGDAPLVGVELKPAKGTRLDPVFARYYLPRLDLFLAPARAALDWDFGKVREAGEKLSRGEPPRPRALTRVASVHRGGVPGARRRGGEAPDQGPRGPLPARTSIGRVPLGQSCS